jgi:hypothetical protein
MARLIDLGIRGRLEARRPYSFLTLRYERDILAKCISPWLSSGIEMKAKKTKNTLRKPKKLEETKPLSRNPWLITPNK